MLLLLARMKVSTTLVDGKPAAVVGVAVGVLVAVLVGVNVAGIDVDVCVRVESWLPWRLV